MTLLGEAIKRTPLHPVAVGLRAEFGFQLGWQVAERFTNRDAECSAARNRVAMADESTNGKVGTEGSRAETVFQAAFDLPTLDIGRGGTFDTIRVYRLRGDLFFVSTPPGQEQAVGRALRSAADATGHFVSVTDLTHARSEIRIIGPRARELLNKVCGLDFQPDAFGEGAAKLSSLAKTTQLIVRRDIGPLPAFSIIGAASLGRYLWKTLAQAGKEFEIEPIGRVALNSLQETS